MKVALLFSSKHGRTRKVVQEALRQLAVKPDVFEVKDIPAGEGLPAYEIFLLFTPTYGDEELHEEMETFLRNLTLDLTGKKFVLCELGNYGGYDDFTFGALQIVRRRLLELHGTEFCPALSLDSFPKLSWEQLSRWVALVNRSLSTHEGP